MGVLDARYKAEKVGYPVVGEQIKDASDVVDYDIHDEITKDLSNTINANNQTTTGMANIIPGINAPKLLADTSITGLEEYAPEGSFYGNASVRATTGSFTAPPGDSDVYIGRYVTVSSNTLPFEWKTDAEGLVIPRTGGYSIQATYDTTGQSEFTAHYTLYLGNKIIGSYTGWSGNTSTYQVNAEKGDTLWFEGYIHNSFLSSYTKDLAISYTITPK